MAMSQDTTAATGPTPRPSAVGAALAAAVAAAGLLGGGFAASLARSAGLFCLGGRDFCEAQDSLVPASVGGAVAVLLAAALLHVVRDLAAPTTSAAYGAVLVGLADVLALAVLGISAWWVPGSAITALTTGLLVAGTAAAAAAHRGASRLAVVATALTLAGTGLAVSMEVTAWPLAPAAALWVAAVAGGLRGRAGAA